VTPILRWWRLAQAVVERVAAPRTDIAQADRRFEEQLRSSASFRSLHHAMLSFYRAAGTSRSLGLVAAARRDWRAVSRESRVSAVGLVVATASTTILMSEAVRPAGIGPFEWLLPSLALAAGVAVLAAAGPIAKALDRADS
jgi:hypothetical protein